MRDLINKFLTTVVTAYRKVSPKASFVEYIYNLSTQEGEVKGLGIQGILITKSIRDQLLFHETLNLKIKPDGYGIYDRRILGVFWLASLA